MKKFTVKLIALLVVVICTLSAYCIPTSAIDIVYNYNNRMYTLETLTQGRSVAIYAQTMGDTWQTSTVTLQSYCTGGRIDEFKTTFYLKIYGSDFTGIPCTFNTMENESHGNPEYGVFEYTDSVYGVPTAQGYVEHICTSLTDSSDKWLKNYLHSWSFAQGGWQPY